MSTDSPLDKLEPRTAQLVHELRTKLGLSQVDAVRAAFTILAVKQGWSKARVGRYLGVTRARVHQRVAKYEQYAASGGYPNLKKALSAKRPAKPVASELTIEFKPADWENESFAIGMLERVS